MNPSMAAAGLKEAHDVLLALKPDDAEHIQDKCPLCALETLEQPQGDIVSEAKTYTEDEMAAAAATSASAIADLKAQLDALTSEAGVAAIQEALDAAVAEKDEKIAELQAAVDEAVLKAQAAEDARVELETYLAAEKAAADEAVVAAERKEERVEACKAAVNFPDEHYTDEFQDRLAAMADEQFTAQLADWSALAPKAAGDEGTGIPAATGFQAARKEATGGSVLSTLDDIRRATRSATL